MLGLIQRGGAVILHRLPNVQQATIQPIITQAVALGTLINTDDYDIYARLPAWGYGHKTVCHAHGECARDEDGDGFCEVHLNTIEGFWSLLRSWLRPHRGISRNGGKSPGTQVQHTLSIGTKGTEFRRFLASKCGTVRAITKSARGFAPITNACQPRCIIRVSVLRDTRQRIPAMP